MPTNQDTSEPVVPNIDPTSDEPDWTDPSVPVDSTPSIKVPSAENRLDQAPARMLVIRGKTDIDDRGGA